jgi:hypothetical protein
VPTPFNHIVLAEQVLSDPALSPQTRAAVTGSRGAFLLSNTAPDLGTLSGRPRAETHFFQVPMRSERPAYMTMFDKFPALRDLGSLSPGHAAFMIGYAAHLWLDQAWIALVFEPYFGLRVRRGGFHRRLVEHNLLRAHLDRIDHARLPDDVAEQLRSVEPDGWLPFAGDEEIRAWRDHLVGQVEPGGQAKTVEVFAAKLGIPPEEFANQLNAREAFQAKVLDVLPDGLLNRFWELGLRRSVRIVGAFGRGSEDSAPVTSAVRRASHDLTTEWIGDRP